MTALDEIENNAMYNAYVSQAMADKAYEEQKNYLEGGKDSALEANAQNRANTMRENAIMTERAKEYAEKRALLSGMGKTGVSQTAMIDLYSQMAGARADAQASYDNQERTIIQEYQDALFEAQRERDAAVMNAQNTANLTASDVAVQRAQQSEVNHQNKVDGLVTAIAEYEAGVIGLDELKSRYNSVKDYLNDEQDFEVIEDYKANAEKAQRLLDELVANVPERKIENIEELNGEKVTKMIDALNTQAQRNYAGRLLTRIKKGEFEDGTIIHFNAGVAKDGDKAFFVYKNGKLYRTEMKFADVAKAEREGIPVVSSHEKNYWANNY